MSIRSLINHIIKTKENIHFVRIMVDMAYLAEMDGFTKEIILAFFLFRIGYIIEINSKSYCSYKIDYGKNSEHFLSQFGISDKIINIVRMYSLIKQKKNESKLKKNIQYGLYLHIAYYESLSLERINNIYISNCLPYHFEDKLNIYLNMIDEHTNKNTKN